MKTPAPSTFESELLRDMASAVERRDKAIRSHGSLKYSRSFENSIERLNLDFVGILGFRVRVSIWSDGVLWLGITKPGPGRIGGWAYRDEFHSQVDSLDTNAFVKRFEQTIHSPTQARNIWSASQDETPKP